MSDEAFDVLDPPPKKCGTCIHFKRHFTNGVTGDCLAPVPRCCPDPFKYEVYANQDFKFATDGCDYEGCPAWREA